MKVRVPQVRILRALAKAFKRGGRGLTRPQIAEQAKVSLSMTANVGPVKLSEVKATDEHYEKRSLISLGLIRCDLDTVNGQEAMIYTITAKGRRVLEEIEAREGAQV